MKYKSILIESKPIPDEITSHVLESIKGYAAMEGIKLYTGVDCPQDINESVLIAAVGGDGTMLGAMRTALIYKNSMVLGINTGTLGFLSNDYFNSRSKYRSDYFNSRSITNALSDISRGEYMVEERMPLNGRIFVDGKPVNKEIIAINELSLSSTSIQQPLTVETRINNKFVSHNSGSGVLVASATGSTAMSLSSGGAIVSPSTNIMQIVPMLSHTLTTRPIITTGRDTVSLISELTDRLKRIDVYGDGNHHFTLDKTTGHSIELQVYKNEKRIRILRPKDWNFFDVLSEKMKW